MPQTVTPVGTTWPASLTAHADGDLVDGAGWLARIQDYANALEFIRLRALGVAVNYPIRQVVSIYSFSGFAVTVSGGPGGNAIGIAQTSVAAVPGFTTQLQLPKGDLAAKLISVKVYFRPANSHAGLPTDQPQFVLIRQPSDGTAQVQFAGPQQLAAGSVPAYENPQVLTLTLGGGGHVISASDNYYLTFFGEVGTNALVGCLVTLIEAIVAPA